MPPMEVAELLARAEKGDQYAWRQIVLQYQRLVMAVLWELRVPKEDGEDVFQEVFIRLFRHVKRIDEPKALSKWIIVTTRNAWIDLVRHRQMAEDHLGEIPLPTPAELPHETIERLELAQRIREHVRALPQHCRRLLWLLFFEQPEPDYEAAAKQLNMPRGSIGPNRARCVAALRRRLQRDEGARP